MPIIAAWSTLTEAETHEVQYKFNIESWNHIKSAISAASFSCTLFPTCQVRVVRFYVSHFSSSFSAFSSFSFSSCRPPPGRISTAILWVQCGVLDPNRDPASAVWRAGPQPRSCEFSVACRTPTVISWVQCCVPDLKLRFREFSVACRTPTAIMRVQCGGPDPNRDPVSSVWRAGPQVLCQKICQKEWQKICQKECEKTCQKECQKICQKECQEICQKEWRKIRQKDC